MKNAAWADCVAFHGHECGGLAIGYKAALYAIELLGLEFSGDEEVCCIAENDACSIDAIQVMLGCSAGKGNLMFHLTGKQAYTFYERSSGRSARIVLREKPEGMTREESRAYYLAHEPRELFDVKAARIPLPEPARIFRSVRCAKCGETFAESFAHLAGGEILCPDCFEPYSRFRV